MVCPFDLINPLLSHVQNDFYLTNPLVLVCPVLWLPCLGISDRQSLSISDRVSRPPDLLHISPSHSHITTVVNTRCEYTQSHQSTIGYEPKLAISPTVDCVIFPYILHRFHITSSIS